VGVFQKTSVTAAYYGAGSLACLEGVLAIRHIVQVCESVRMLDRVAKMRRDCRLTNGALVLNRSKLVSTDA
jgi:hypothetical protein